MAHQLTSRFAVRSACPLEQYRETDLNPSMIQRELESAVQHDWVLAPPNRESSGLVTMVCTPVADPRPVLVSSHEEVASVDASSSKKGRNCRPRALVRLGKRNPNHVYGRKKTPPVAKLMVLHGPRTSAEVGSPE